MVSLAIFGDILDKFLYKIDLTVCALKSVAVAIDNNRKLFFTLILNFVIK